LLDDPDFGCIPFKNQNMRLSRQSNVGWSNGGDYYHKYYHLRERIHRFSRRSSIRCRILKFIKQGRRKGNREREEIGESGFCETRDGHDAMRTAIAN